MIFDFQPELPEPVVAAIDGHIEKHNGVARALQCDRYTGYDAEDEQDQSFAHTAYLATQQRASAYASVMGWAKTIEVYREDIPVGQVGDDPDSAALPAIRFVADVFGANNAVRQTVVLHIEINDVLELIHDLTNVAVGAAYVAGDQHQPLTLRDLDHRE